MQDYTVLVVALPVPSVGHALGSPLSMGQPLPWGKGSVFPVFLPSCFGIGWKITRLRSWLVPPSPQGLNLLQSYQTLLLLRERSQTMTPYPLLLKMNFLQVSYLMPYL